MRISIPAIRCNIEGGQGLPANEPEQVYIPPLFLIGLSGGFAGVTELVDVPED